MAKKLKDRDNLLFHKDVDLDLRRKALAVLRDLRGQGYPAVVVEVVRTPAKAILNLKNGASLIGLKSKHVPTKTRKCQAVDIAFDNGKGKITWDVPAEWWKKLGSAYESHGMIWGGRWKKLRDYNHGELP